MPRNFMPLKRKRDFRMAYEHGRSYANRLLVLYVSKEGMVGRMGFSVSKKVGKAVTRNKVKRQLKEACHQLLNGISLPGDCIVIARVGASKATYGELVGALSDLFKRAKVLS